MRAVDLTLTVEDDTPTYPGDPETSVDDVATVKDDGYAVKRLSFPSHVGTHVDAPAHMFEDGKTVDDYGVGRFVGEAVVVDVRGRVVVEPDVLDGIGDVEAVLFRTGWVDEMYGDEEYYDDGPVLSVETAEALVDRGVGTFGLDAPSPDKPPYPVHEVLLGNDVLLLEDLTNLGAVGGGRFRCHALPLRVADADGAPCRVVGFVD